MRWMRSTQGGMGIPLWRRAEGNGGARALWHLCRFLSAKEPLESPEMTSRGLQVETTTRRSRN